MGVHHSYMFDWKKREGVAQAGSWTASTLFPVQPMYDAQTGHINAILVNNPHASLHVFPLGWWEGPFINMLFCKVLCFTLFLLISFKLKFLFFAELVQRQRMWLQRYEHLDDHALLLP